MILFLLVCTASLLAGLGILTACRLELDPVPRWLLAPCVGLAFWAVLLGIGVSLGFPVRRLALPLWIATALAAAYGASQARKHFVREAIAPLLVALILPLLLLAADFRQGLTNYIGNPGGDGWSYVAYGQYLWELTKGSEGHLAPLYQYAAHLNGTRFISSAMLGFLSPLARGAGDTQAAVGLFLAWALFVAGASGMALAWSLRIRGAWLLLAGILCVLSPWVFGTIELHNYDNLLVLPFVPAAMTLAQGSPGVSRRTAVVLGGLLAASAYIYPEMAAFTWLAAGVMIAWSLVTQPGRFRSIASAAVLIGVAGVLLWPWRHELLSFTSLQLQNAAAPAGGRPGEGEFSELLHVRDWIAVVWGLEFSTMGARFVRYWNPIRQALGSVLWILTVVGVVRLVRQRQWEVVAVAALLLAGASYFAGYQQYGYAAYKFLALGWCLVICVLVTGAHSIAAGARTTSWRVRSVGVGVVGVTTAVMLASMAARVVAFRDSLPVSSLETYRHVLEIEPIVGMTPIVVDVDSPVANEWAVYFLRNHPMRLVKYRAYMAQSHVIPLMDRSAPIAIQDASYVLTGAGLPGSHDVVWSDGPYMLWRRPRVSASSHLDGSDTYRPENAFDGDETTEWAAQGASPASVTIERARAGVLESIQFIARKTTLLEVWRAVEVRLFLRGAEVSRQMFSVPTADRERIQEVSLQPVETDRVELHFSEPVARTPSGKDAGPGSVNPGYAEIVMNWRTMRVSASSYYGQDEAYRPENALDGDPVTEWAAQGSEPASLVVTPVRAGTLQSIRLVGRQTGLIEAWQKLDLHLFLRGQEVSVQSFSFPNAFRRRTQEVTLTPIEVDRIELHFSDPVMRTPAGELVGPVNPGYAEVVLSWKDEQP